MRFTVFTPAYNRANGLQILYESLRKQDNWDFEWLIIDDGSTDDTALVVESFQSDLFPVRYVYKENGGKHTAYNQALQYAQGEFFFCVDSDDFVPENIFGKLSDFTKHITQGRGIAAYKVYPNGKKISSDFPPGVKESGTRQLYEEYRCTGDFAFIYPTAIAKQYPFPVFQQERFVTESVIFDRMDAVCPLALYPEAVSVCEYMEDGYSQNADRIMKENPCGYCLYFMQRIDLVSSQKLRMMCAGKYWCFWWMGGKPPVRYTGKHRLLTGLCLPLGLIFRGYYKFVRGF